MALVGFRFYFHLAILTLVILALGYYVTSNANNYLTFSFFSVLQFIVVLITGLVHTYLVHAFETIKRPQQMATRFMLATVIKLFVYLGGLGLYAIITKFIIPSEVDYASVIGTFFILYFIYSIFEVFKIINYIRSKGVDAP